MKIILKLRHRRIPEMIIYTLPVTRSRNRLLQSDSENTKQFQSLSYSLCWRLKTWLDLVIFVEPCTKINDAYTIVMCFCDRSCCQRYAVSAGKDYVFQQDSAPAHVQQLNCCVKKRQIFLRPTHGLQTAQISVLWITRSGLSCSVVSTRDKSILWIN